MVDDLKKINELIKNRNFIKSLESINQIPNHEKNFDLITLKAYVYLNLKEFKKSYECYSIAININNDSFICFNLRATASF